MKKYGRKAMGQGRLDGHFTALQPQPAVHPAQCHSYRALMKTRSRQTRSPPTPKNSHLHVRAGQVERDARIVRLLSFFLIQNAQIKLAPPDFRLVVVHAVDPHHGRVAVKLDALATMIAAQAGHFMHGICVVPSVNGALSCFVHQE